MAFDIREGDLLVVGSDEYPIIEAHVFDVTGFLTGGSYGRLATISCSTKRRPAATGGLQGEPATKLSSLSCTPLDPYQPEINRAPITNAPGRLLETYVQSGADIARLIVRQVRR